MYDNKNISPELKSSDIFYGKYFYYVSYGN